MTYRENDFHLTAVGLQADECGSPLPQSLGYVKRFHPRDVG